MTTSRRRYFLLVFLLSGLLGGCKSAAPTAGEKSGGGLLSGLGARGGCYNAYYPASATLKKTYKTVFAGNGLPPSTHNESYANVTADGFTQKMEFAPSDLKAKSGAAPITTEALTVESGIKCRPEGLMALDYSNLTSGQNTKFKFKTIKADGVTFPNESDWKPGKKWTMSYEVEGQMMGAPAAINMAPKGTIVLDSEIVGAESVTVPAGTFQTLKVVLTMNQKLNLNMMGREIPMNNSIKTNAWFAKDVGMVKSQTDLAGATTELMALTK